MAHVVNTPVTGVPAAVFLEGCPVLQRPGNSHDFGRAVACGEHSDEEGIEPGVPAQGDLEQVSMVVERLKRIARHLDQ